MISLMSRKTLPENIVIRLIHRSIHGQGVERRLKRKDVRSYRNMFPNHYINFCCDSYIRNNYNFKRMIRFDRRTGYLLIGTEVDQSSETDSNRDESTDLPTAFDGRIRMYEVKKKVNIRDRYNHFCIQMTGDASYCVFVGYTPYDRYVRGDFDFPGIRGDYALYIIDTNSGEICDRIDYEADRMMLLENKCIQVCENTLAVLSLEHQKIHIYKIVEGSACSIRVIGKFCHLDNAHYLNAVFADESDRQPCMDDLMHQLLDFLYRKATRTLETTNSTFEKEKFAGYIDNLFMLRLQQFLLLDERHLLLRYCERTDVFVQCTVRDLPLKKPDRELLVVYNIPRDEIRAVYTNQNLENDTGDQASIFFSRSLFSSLYSKLLRERNLVIYRKPDNID